MKLNRDYHQNQQRTTKDDDQESGTGNSIPQSPFRENEASYVEIRWYRIIRTVGIISFRKARCRYYTQ